MAPAKDKYGGSRLKYIPSTLLTELLLIALIMTSLILEMLLHKLEKWVATRHLHLQAVLRNLYRELMILGLVSFVFITYEAITHPDSETVGSFELAHLFIFLFAIVHTLVVLTTVAASLSLSYRWRRMEAMDLVRYLELKEEYGRARVRRHAHYGPLWRKVQWWMPDPRKLTRYWRLHEIMAFHDIRFQFLYYRDLPEDFNFSGYLRKVKAVMFIDLVDMHWSLWVFFLALVAIDVVRREIWKAKSYADGDFEAIFAICAASFLVLVATLITFKISRVYWALLKHPATYFDDVTKDEVLLKGKSKNSLSLDRRNINPAAPSDDDKTFDGGSTIRSSEIESHMSSYVAPGADPVSPGAAQILVTDQSETDTSSSRLPTADFETHSTITNLVWADHGDHGVEPRRKASAKKKLKTRVLEPAPASAIDLAEVAVKHGLRTEGNRRSIDKDFDQNKVRRSSVDGRTSMESGPRRLVSRLSVDGRPHLGGKVPSLGSLSLSAAGPTSFEKMRGSVELERNPMDPGRRVLNNTDDGAGAGVVGGVPVGTGTGVEDAGVAPASPKHAPASPHHVAVDVSQYDAGTELDSSKIFSRSSREYHKNGSAGPERMNASIVKHAEDRVTARDEMPHGVYPKWVVLLFPRLCRTACRAEKLFWFGSHRFFLWLVEFVLFFSTVLFAATVASTALVALRAGEDGRQPVTGMAAASVVTSAVALVYVLVGISYVMKKYVFVLNNASLVPEKLAVEVIHNVRQKRQLMNRLYADAHDDASGSDPDKEEAEAARERRRKFSRFFATDARASGHFPGENVSDDGKGMAGLRKRRQRARGPAPEMPSARGDAQPGYESE